MALRVGRDQAADVERLAHELGLAALAASSAVRGSARISGPMRTPSSSVSAPLTVVRLSTSRTPSSSARRRERRSMVASDCGREDVAEHADDVASSLPNTARTAS